MHINEEKTHYLGNHQGPDRQAMPHKRHIVLRHCYHSEASQRQGWTHPAGTKKRTFEQPRRKNFHCQVVPRSRSWPCPNSGSILHYPLALQCLNAAVSLCNNRDWCISRYFKRLWNKPGDVIYCNSEYFVCMFFSYVSHAAASVRKLKKKHTKNTEQVRESAVSGCTKKFHAYERSEVPSIRKFSVCEIFWIYSTGYYDIHRPRY